MYERIKLQLNCHVTFGGNFTGRSMLSSPYYQLLIYLTSSWINGPMYLDFLMCLLAVVFVFVVVVVVVVVFKCNRTIGSRSIEHLVWSISLNILTE